jgi:hypothetical protein
MTEDFGLAILYLTALAAYLSLGWVIWCAGRWLYRWLHPWNAEVDARARAYLIKPHPLWTGPPPSLVERKGGWEKPRASWLPTTAATKRTTADTDTAQGTSPPAGIPWPQMTADDSQLVAEDIASAKRSSWRVVDSPVSTEET